MAIKHIILHVGLHKTGTSSIQETCYKSWRVLCDNGICYPRFLGVTNHVALLKILNLDESSFFSDLSAENLQHIFWEEINKSNCETLLLSWEGFSHCNFAQISAQKLRVYFTEKFPEADCKVIIYVRNPYDYCKSFYNEMLISPYEAECYDKMSASIIAYLNKSSLNNNVYDKTIYFFEKYFGKQNIALYTFEEAIKYPTGFIGFFINKILRLPDSEIIKFFDIRNNESRCGEVAELLDYFNNMTFLVGGLKRTYLDVEPILHINGSRFTLPPNEIQYYASLLNTRWLLKNYGIDYTQNTKSDIPSYSYPEWKLETLQQLIEVYYLLPSYLREFFLTFFQKKYEETGEEKFLNITRENSTPRVTEKFIKQFMRSPLSGSGIHGHIDGVNFPPLTDVVEIHYAYLEEEFNGIDTRCFPVFDKKKVHISLSFSKEFNIKRFRIDPSHFPCIVLLEKLLVNTEENNVQLVYGNHFDQVGDTFGFFCDNPMLSYTTTEPIISLEIELIVDKGSYPFIYYAKRSHLQTHMLREKLEEKRRELLKVTELLATFESVTQSNIQLMQISEQQQNELHLLRQLKDEQDKTSSFRQKEIATLEDVMQSNTKLIQITERQQNEINSLRQLKDEQDTVLSMHQKEIAALLNSTSWKLTKPLRLFRRLFKRAT